MSVRYVIFIVILSVALFLFFVGCQSDDTRNDSDNMESLQDTILTLAVIDGIDRNYREAIFEYNKKTPGYNIEIVEYSDIDLLTLDLVTGNMLDMLYITMLLPYADYVSNGLFEDLYPYIDADPSLSRNSIIPAVLRATETDGSLYSIFPDFYVYTYLGHPSVVGANNGWSIDEFETVLSANPQADIPFGFWETQVSFLMNTIRADINKYIDIEAGSVSLNSSEFIHLLNFSNRFTGDKFIKNKNSLNIQESVSQEEAISTGRQVVIPVSISGLSWFLIDKTVLGGDIAMKGWPSDTGNNHEMRTKDNNFAILTTSTNKDASWSFLRTFLDRDWQLNNTFSFPSNQEAFNQRVIDEMESYYKINGSSITPCYEYPTKEILANEEILQITQGDVNMIMELINSSTTRNNIDEVLDNIIREEIKNFVDKKNSAEDTARFLQSRM